MRKTLVAVAAVVGVAALTACGGADQAAPVSETASQAPATTSRSAHPGKSADAVDDIYVDFLHDNGIYSSRSTLIDLGHTVCEAFDQGMSFNEVGLTALSSGTSWGVEEIGTVIGASVAAFCPWNEHVIPGGRTA